MPPKHDWIYILVQDYADPETSAPVSHIDNALPDGKPIKVQALQDRAINVRGLAVLREPPSLRQHSALSAAGRWDGPRHLQYST